MLKQRLPSSDNTSPDGIRYLEQVMPVMQDVLEPIGFQQITLNDNPSFKDHAFGYSAYNVSALLRWKCISLKPPRSSSTANVGDQ